MADKVKVTVTGVQETVAAFDKLDSVDVRKVEDAAGKAVVDAVKGFTRSDSGDLASAWDVAGGEFINYIAYAGYQEFGTTYVDPTFAVRRAWETQEKQAQEAAEKVYQDVAAKAGFDT